MIEKNEQKKNILNIPIWENGLLLSGLDLTSFKHEESFDISSLNNLNILSGSDWTRYSKSVQLYNGAITRKRKKHGAAFPLSLANHFINIYSKPGDIILDPFSGVGTTLDSANILKRHSIGIELNEEFVKLFNLGIDPKDGVPNKNYRRVIIQDTALNVMNHLPNDFIDLILTSPPYSNLLNNIRENFADKDYAGNPYKNQSRKLAKAYSTNELDLGNVSYDIYLKNIKLLFNYLYRISKPGAYNVWVVRDYRNTKDNIPYINLHGDIINMATKVGWILWDLVIWDQSSQRKLVRLGGNKSRRFYFNIGHSFIIIFRKNLIGECYK